MLWKTPLVLFQSFLSQGGWESVGLRGVPVPQSHFPVCSVRGTPKNSPAKRRQGCVASSPGMLAHLCNSLSWGGQGWLFAGVGSGHEGWSVHRPKCGERARASCRLCLLFRGGHGLSHIAKESEKVAQMYSLGVEQFRTKYIIFQRW